MASKETAPQLIVVPDGATGDPSRDLRREAPRELSLIERQGIARRVIRFMSTTLLVTLIIGLVGALVLHATIIENQRELDQQRAQIRRIGGETEALRSALAELEAPARIVHEAIDLGMIEAPSIQYITAPAGALDERTLIVASNQLQDN